MLFGVGVRFAEDLPSTGGDVPELMWIQVAREGTYEGHWQGSFDLTREVFESFVKNLHAHPQFKLGEIDVDGKRTTAGTSPTIPFDYEHASEMPATEGTIPQQGAEAPAWVYDIAIRDGEGGAELWALAWLGERVRDQIKRRAYRQTSIAFDLEGVDFISGDSVGPILTSIAFTNHPFLKHLESYAARNRGGHPRRGVAQQPASSSKASGKDDDNQRGRSPMGANDDNKQHEQFKVTLCRKLRIRALADEDQIGEAVEEAVTAGSSLDKLLEALGVADVSAALEGVPKLRAAQGQLEAALSELQDMLGAQDAMDEMAAEAEVGAVMKALKQDGNEAMKDALMTYRAKCIEDAVSAATREFRLTTADDARLPVKKVLAARVLGRKAFLEKYGIKGDVDVSNLTRTFVASKDGQHPAPPGLDIRDRSDTGGGSRGGGETGDLSSAPGTNPTDKCVRYLSGKDPEYAKLPHLEKVRRAVEFMQKNDVIAVRRAS